ncbi:MAG: methyltransferase domain-containing protein [Methanobacteriaceae archaeon]|jgi:predicted SAM-dependent methyltransferase|nr:methyltransferase domain-containing protein [Candidatus Methanorudis spinitermitis]
MKLHLGCGDKYLESREKESYIHCDIRENDNIDYVLDLKNLNVFIDNSIDEIYACHVLEHFGRFEINNVLSEWNRVLKKEGVLRLAVPNFEEIVGEFLENSNVDAIIGLLYGGQDYKYNFHKYCFTFDSLSKLLEDNGFYNVNIYDWKDFLPEGYDDFSRAYLPHMDFENGRLMSLNVTANKR